MPLHAHISSIHHKLHHDRRDKIEKTKSTHKHKEIKSRTIEWTKKSGGYSQDKMTEYTKEMGKARARLSVCQQPVSLPKEG
jgi:hypothetical protein